MSDMRLPAGPEQDANRLPVPRDPGQPLVMHRGLPAIALEAADERRDDDEIDLLAYWRILVKRRRLLASVVAAGVAASLLATLMTQPLYRASATMQIEKEPPPIVQTTGAMPYYDAWDPEFLNTQYELLRSRALAERVANELDLGADALQRLRAPGWFNRVAGLLRPGAAPKPDAQAAPATVASAGAAARTLKEATGLVQAGLSVTPVKESRLVRLDFDSTSPDFSVRAVNAIADGFIASSIERRMGTTSYAKTYLEDQLAQTKAKLEDSERKLVEFAQKEGLVNTGEQGTSLATQNLTDLNASLAEAQGDRIRAASRWRQASGGALSADMIAGTNIGTLQQQRATLQLQYQQKLQTYKPDYPEMLSLKGQIDEVERQVSSETARARAAVKAEYDAAVARESMLKGQIGALRGQALDTDSRSIQYNILKREADTNRQLYDSLLQRYKMVGASSDARPNNITIIDRAQVPGGAYSPNGARNLAIGLFLGLLLGVALALLLEFLDDTIKTPEDVEQKLRLSVLGIIPRLGAKQSVATAAQDLRSPFSEAYRSVRTALQFSTDHGVPRTLLLTSAGPGEGKSTSALSLARNFAQLGKRVLLIEADMRNPSLHRSLAATPTGKGLSSLLAGAATLQEVVVPSGEAQLDVIFAGPLPPNPAELLSGTRLVSLLSIAGQHYDQVVIDGPPVMGIADGPLLANGADGTLLVVDSGSTKIGNAQAALKRLLVARARVIGVLLTKYNPKAAGHGYHYESYYAYGGPARLPGKSR